MPQAQIMRAIELFGTVVAPAVRREVGTAVVDIRYVNARPRPVALYFFGKSSPARAATKGSRPSATRAPCSCRAA
jgi:hypothetical protein